MSLRSWLSCCAVLLSVWGVWGCSAESARSTFSDGGQSSAGGSGPGGTGGTTTTTGTGGDIGLGGMHTGGSEPVVAEVFGHSSDVLYMLNPLTHEVTQVGSFSGCSSVIDLAINKDHQLVATTFAGLYHIDKTNAACTLISEGSYPNSLSFVPEGTVDPTQEALVGYNGSNYVRIDTSTGDVTPLGSIGSGYASSGDIVSVIDGGTYLTVTSTGCSDCLLEVDPITGDLVKDWGPIPHTQVFGLAFWGGSAYGFTNGGQLFQIEFGADSVTCTTINIPNAPPGLSFWGAGSSTAAPLRPPT